MTPRRSQFAYAVSAFGLAALIPSLTPAGTLQINDSSGSVSCSYSSISVNPSGSVTLGTTSCLSGGSSTSSSSGGSTSSSGGSSTSSSSGGSTSSSGGSSTSSSSSGGSSGGSSDPGRGTWTAPDGTIVFDRASFGDRMHIPGCIGHSGPEYVCQFQNTINGTQQYAMRIPFLHASSLQQISVTTNQSLSTYGTFDVAFSTTPGDFNPPDLGCHAEQTVLQTTSFVDASLNASLSRKRYCFIPANTIFYVNVRMSGTGASTCGQGSTCRVIIHNGFEPSAMAPIGQVP